MISSKRIPILNKSIAKIIIGRYSVADIVVISNDSTVNNCFIIKSVDVLARKSSMQKANVNVHYQIGDIMKT